MPLEDIEVGLSDEDQAIRDTAHKYAEEVMRPAGAQLDRLHDPAQVVAADSVLWSVFEKYRELDFDMVEAGDAESGPIQVARIRYLVNEELGWGDSGLAISLGVAGFPAMFARLSGRPEAAGPSPSRTMAAILSPSTSPISPIPRSTRTASRARTGTST
jgi:alkylation response protein AidB-like acyl-CoA dehydrogenase